MIEIFHAGGFVMYPLLVGSLVVWFVIFERIYRYWRLRQSLQAFQLEAINTLLRADRDALSRLCAQNSELPTARLLAFALERQASKDKRLSDHWPQAVERRRQIENQELKQYLWILGTIASASPFVGLFGTVVGILQSFHAIAQTGKGGFAIVAAGISEALIATAAGIILAVIAVMAFNSFQTKWAQLVLLVKTYTAELSEMLSASESDFAKS